MEIAGFIVKKAISALLQPLGISLILLFTGLIVWKVKHWSRRGAALIVAGTGLLLVLSFPITSYLLLRGLEAQAGSYQNPASLEANGVRYIVVLGGAGSTDGLTPADRTGPSIFRVLEGVRLWRGIPGSRLVLSGMGFPLEANVPDFMKALPIELGVSADALTIYASAWDTGDEAAFLAGLVGDSPFALVSAAYHIPRAMRQFQSRGLKAIASPCAFMAKTPPPLYRYFLPDGSALLGSQLAIHEYLGQLWMTVRKVAL
ncbi:MAG: ElyC/SanA/YdcF family protein [Thermodesulfobacteriota bacterium]